MENKTKVSVVIVNWNGKKDTQKCLASFQKVKDNTIDLTVIVVDNGSSDDSVSQLKKTFPWVTILTSGKNLGFSGGNNIGISYALKRNSDIIWLLNNDTFVDKNVLSAVQYFKDKKVGICGSKIYFAPGHEFHHDRYSNNERGKVIWYAGGLIDWNNMYASHRGVDEVDKGQYNSPIVTQFITGCSMFIRREVFEKIGLLDDKFFLYLEDVDFCLRSQKAGFKLLFTPNSHVWHVNAGSSSRPGNPMHEYYFTRNRILIGLRWAPMRTKFSLIRESFRFILKGSKIRRMAVLDALTGKFGDRYSL